MSVALIINGVTFNYPEAHDPAGWGDQVEGWAQAVTDGFLPKIGGTFDLTGEIDFGSSYGFKLLYLKSETVNSSASGVVRLANGNTIGWRNNANSADLLLTVNSSDQLLFNGFNLNPLTTKGDLYTNSGSNNIRLPVGTSLQLLVPDSTTSSGLNWIDNPASQVFEAAFAFSGFLSIAETTISFSGATRIFTITPVSSTFDLYVAGVKYQKTTETITLPDVPGYYFIYYDTSATLQYVANPPNGFDYSSQIPVVALVYVNAFFNQISDERHGIAMDHATLEYFIATTGKTYVSGLEIIGYTLTGDGNSDVDAQISITDGVLLNGDARITPNNNVSPTDNFQQILNGPTQLFVSYLSSAGFITPVPGLTEFPVMQGVSTIQYNTFDGDNWSTVEADDGKFVGTWIVATATTTNPIIACIGLRQTNTLEEYIAASTITDLKTIFGTNLIEVRPLYLLIFQTDSTYSNIPHAALRAIVDYRVVPLTAPLDHSTLTGLNDDTHLQYVHISIPRIITAQHSFAPVSDQPPFILGSHAQNQKVIGFDADKLDGLDSTAFQPIDADLTALSSTSTTGIYTITGSGTSTTRSIVGTSNQITVTNGSAVSGNPTIALASNPIIPGTAGMTIPNGTSAQRAGTPDIGQIRYNSDYSSAEYFSQGSWTQFGNQSLSDTMSPQGLVDASTTTLTYDTGTRIISIAPVVTSYAYYYNGIKIVKSSTDSVTIPSGVTSIWLIYFDSSGILQAIQTAIDFKTQVVIAAVFRNDSTGQMIVADLRHGATMDWATKQYLQTTVGAKFVGGLNLANYTLSGDGSSDSDAELAVNDGSITISDFIVTIQNNATPTEEWEQILSPVAEISVFYRTGTDPLGWTLSTATDFPVYQGTSRIKYNLNTAGTWTTPDASSDGNYVAMWVLASSAIGTPIFCFLGQRQDTTLADAQANNTLGALDLGGVAGFVSITKFLYRLIFKTDSAYTNTPKAILADILDLRATDTPTISVATTVTSHGSLTGLGADDHLQYVHIANARIISAQHTFSPIITQAPFILDTNAQGQIVTGFNADLLDGLDATAFQPVDSDLTALAGISSTGIYVVTGSGTSTTRSLTAPAAGITISNSNGVSGNPTLVLANDLAAVEGLSSTGLTARTASDTWTTRSLTAPAAGITISNNDGVSGNPTFALANDLAAVEGLSSTGYAVRIASDTWINRSISGTSNQITVTNGDGVAGNSVIVIANNPIMPGNASMTVPIGNTSQQPGVATDGMIRYNSQTTLFEFRQNGNFINYQLLDSDLSALSSTSTTGLYTITGSGTSTTITITAGSSKISISNGDGVAGNPTIDVSEANLTLNNIGGTLGTTKGGTNLTTYTLGDIVYSSASNTLSKLAGNTTTTRNFLRQTGTGSVSAAPSWDTVTKTDVGLSNVENTALSTWAGSTNITTLGTISAGTWTGSVIGGTYGGTGINNGSNTITLGGNLTTSGAFNTTLTVTADTNVTLPTSGTLITSSVTTLSSLVSIGTITTGIWHGSVIGEIYGGTNQSTYSTGDILYASASNTLSKLAGVATGNSLISGGVTTAPSWGKIGLTTHISGVLSESNGGTNQSTYTLGDIIYSNGTNSLGKLAGNTTTTKKFLRQTGNGTISAIPAWDTVTSTDVGLGNVENTALSTWAGSTNITTLGTIATGTWSATTIATNKGGTGLTSIGTSNQILGVNNAASGLEYKTLTAGTGISVTHGANSVTIATTGGSGTVTSVALTVPSIMSVTGSPVTTTGTLAVSLATQNANLIFAGPSSGGAATPTFRSLVYADVVTSAIKLYAENASSPASPATTGTNAVAIGDSASASIWGSKAIANGKFATAGDAQHGIYIVRAITTDATAGVELFLDGAGAAQRLVVPNNSVWTFDILVSARRTDTTGGGAGYRFVGVLRKDTTSASLTFIGTPSKTILGETDTAWDVVLSADTTNGSLKLAVTGQAAKTIRWVAVVNTTEVTN